MLVTNVVLHSENLVLKWNRRMVNFKAYRKRSESMPKRPKTGERSDAKVTQTSPEKPATRNRAPDARTPADAYEETSFFHGGQCTD